MHQKFAAGDEGEGKAVGNRAGEYECGGGHEGEVHQGDLQGIPDYTIRKQQAIHQFIRPEEGHGII